MKGWEIRQKLKPGYGVKVDWSILRVKEKPMFAEGKDDIPSGWYTIEDINRDHDFCHCSRGNKCPGAIKIGSRYHCFEYKGDDSGNINPFVDYHDGNWPYPRPITKRKSLYSRKLRLKVR